MSDTTSPAPLSATFDEHGHWQAPPTFRQVVADTELAAQQLLTAIADEESLLVPTDRLVFLARRVERLARLTHESLPWEVE